MTTDTHAGMTRRKRCIVNETTTQEPTRQVTTYTPREYIVLLLAGVVLPGAVLPDEQPSDEDGERWDTANEL